MQTTLGCIGCGNMGSAILRGLSGREGLRLVGCDPSGAKLAALADAGVEGVADIAAAVRASDIVLVAVKPGQVGAVLGAAMPELDSGKVVVSIASGVSVGSLREMSGGRCPVVRVMPNTPAMVGAGVFALCFEDATLDEVRRTLVKELFEALGRVLVLPEEKFNAFTAVVGCGPAYVFHFMEAVVEAAVTLGFPRHEATDMVVALFAGSVKLAATSGTHLSLLREAVCSPAGNTIAAMNQFDRDAVRGRIIDAILAAYRRGQEMER